MSLATTVMQLFPLRLSLGGTFRALTLIAVVTGGLAPHAKAQLAHDQRLFAHDGQTDDYFGFSVALSGDLAVATTLGLGGAPTGSAYVFRRTGTGWTEEAELRPVDAGQWALAGVSTAISGEFVFVGAMYAPLPGSGHPGAVYVFQKEEGAWVQTQKLVADTPIHNSGFGRSLAADDDVLVVGATDLEFPGAAYVFRRTPTGWVQEQTLTGSDVVDRSFFGHSVAVSGNAVVVGAPDLNASGRPGSAYVFRQAPGGWVQEQRLTASNAAPDERFGWDVAVEGGVAIVTATGESTVARGAGLAYVFRYRGFEWIEEQRLFPAPDTRADIGRGFGHSVGLEGGVAVISDKTTNPSFNWDFGFVHVFRDSDAGFNQEPYLHLHPNDGSGGGRSEYGYDVAVEAGEVLVGCPRCNLQGSAYYFNLPPPTSVAQVRLEHRAAALAALGPVEVFIGTSTEPATRLSYCEPPFVCAGVVSLPVGVETPVRLRLVAPPPVPLPQEVALAVTAPTGCHVAAVYGVPEGSVSLFAANPDGRSIALDYLLTEVPCDGLGSPSRPAARPGGALADGTAPHSGAVTVLPVHAVTDAPALNVTVSGRAVAEGLVLGEAGDPVELAPGTYTVEVHATATGALVGAYTVDLSGVGGEAVTLALQGFLEPAQNQNGPALALVAVGASGTAGEAAVTSDGAPAPADALTLSAYPNPVRAEATVRYTLSEVGPVRLALYDVLGREVSVLFEGMGQAGEHDVALRSAALPAGLYVLRLNTAGRALSRPVTLLR